MAADHFGVHGHGGELGDEHAQRADFEHYGFGPCTFRCLCYSRAVVVGSSVILFGPIFQGLAIALIAGEIASLLLSRMTRPRAVLSIQQGKGETRITIDRYLRMIAGAFVLLTLVLACWVSSY